MYEHRSHHLLSRADFGRRVVRHVTVATTVMLISLGFGVLGYHYLGHLKWIDALLNASMILTGMGPVDPMVTTRAKVFASCYALFSGVVFLGVASVLVAPFAHRLIHKFHLEKSARGID
jgi:hypothetical protein